MRLHIEFITLFTQINLNRRMFKSCNDSIKVGNNKLSINIKVEVKVLKDSELKFVDIRS